MPNLCAVADCTVTEGQGVLMHKWASDPQTAKAWLSFVRQKRKPNPGQRHEWAPSSTTKVCTRHFT